MAETIDEIIFEGGNRAQQMIAWQTMVSQDSLKAEILTLIKEKHSCLLSYDLAPVFNQILEILGDEERQARKNLINMEVKDDNQ